MTGKEITDLTIANDFESGDLISIRKSGQLEDKALAFENLLKSIGNTAVDGFVSTSEDANKITINSANGVAVDQYYNGMKVSFVSPIASTGLVQIKIGALPYKDLFVHKTQDSVVLQQDDYVEAVYIGGKFYQINKTDYVFTNDYNVVLIEPNIAGYTDVTLESAYGILKNSYYKGMSVNFLCTDDTVGLTRISIDGLPSKDILENSGDYIDLIYTPLYKGQIVRLIYDGQSFIKDRFKNDDPKIEPIIVPDPVNPDQPIIPIQNQSLYKVGTNQQFTNMQDALKAIFAEFGENGKKKGGQQKVTLEITSDLLITEEDNRNRIVTYSYKSDLSWITVKATNDVIRFTGKLAGGAGNVWHFYDAFTFQEGTKIDASNLDVGIWNGSPGLYSIITARRLDLKNIEIDAGVNGKAQYCIYMWADGPAQLNLVNCILKAAQNSVPSLGVCTNACNSNIINTKINNWTDRGVTLGIGTHNIQNSDLSKNGTSSVKDIELRGGGVIVNQTNSRAKSNLAPNTNNNTGTYWVTGSQDMQGA